MTEYSAKTLSALEWPRITEALAAYAMSQMGRERCLEVSFHATYESIRETLQETTEMRGLLEGEEAFPLFHIADLREALSMARIGSILEGPTLVDVRDMLGASARVARFLVEHAKEAPLIAKSGARLNPLRDVWKRLSMTLSDNGEVLDHASPHLKDFRREAMLLHNRIKDRIQKMVNESTYLQENYYTLRGDRYVLPVRAEFRHRVRGIVHDTSGSGATIFIEPEELVDLNNQVKLAELRVEEEIRRILSELSQLIAQEVDVISENLVVLATLDFIAARAKLSLKLHATEPIVTQTPTIDLHEVYNPVLLLSKPREDVVPNDLILNGKVLILSGPNTGGKTVTLKTVGLCALMIRAGLHIPTQKGSKLGIFPRIFADVGDEQSMTHNLSTFSGHIYTLIHIIKHVEKGSLILLDEVAVGTDPIQGTALARALLEHFVKMDARVIVTTHYEGLKTLGATDYENASVTFDLTQMAPTYEVVLGQPGKSYALEIAERLGIPENIISRAQTFLGFETRQMEHVISSLEAQHQEYAARNAEIENLRNELLDLKTAYLNRKRKLDEDRQAFQHQIKRDIEGEAERIKKEMNDILKEARKEPETVTILKKKLTGVVKRTVVSQETAKEQPALPPEPVGIVEPIEPIDWGKIRLNDPIFIRSIRKNGKLVAYPNHQNRVRVQLGAMVMTVDINDVESAHGTTTLAESTLKKPSLPAPVTSPDRQENQATLDVQHSGNSCDLRGMRVEDALKATERFLDQAMLLNESPIFIIHGHGTGALKSAVRKYLSASKWIRKWRPGEIHEGGDGVSIVEI